MTSNESINFCPLYYLTMFRLPTRPRRLLLLTDRLDNVRVAAVSDADGGDAEVLAARGTQLDVVCARQDQAHNETGY